MLGGEPLARPHRRYTFPWREGNRFRLLIDGERFFPVMLTAIERARSDILLEMYLFESGHTADAFIAALTAAARRGVAVHLLVDDFGAKALVQRDRERLRRAGVHLAFYNPLHYGSLRRNLFRDHRKLLLVDGGLAYTGGTGLTDAFAGPGGWHESMLEVEGPCAGDWQAAFQHVWNTWGSPPLQLPVGRASPTPGGRPGRVTLSTGGRAVEMKRSLVKRVRGAERRVWLATAYFIPSWKIRRALRRAARRGVDVRVLLPGPTTDHPAVRHAGRRFYAGLLKHGIRIFEYQPRFLHAKMVLCDGWASIGSSNIDRWNLRWNLEGNQETEDEQLNQALEAQLLADFAVSEEIDPLHWMRRPWYRRLSEWFWGKVDVWLERYGQGKP